MRQPVEPFRIKAIESIRLPEPAERIERLKAARYNLFKLDAEEIFIDLLTDSGTAAMSNKQWSQMMLGDESYAGAQSFRRFEKAVQDIFGKRLIIPCHQGRVAENLIFSTLMKPGQYVLNNTHFDTTRGNVLHKGGIPIDLPSVDAQLDRPVPFKGNMDTVSLESFLTQHGRDQVAMVILTITNNSIGGNPVSMANIREVSEICRKHRVLFYFDCARFAENSYFIWRDEPGFRKFDIPEIARQMFSYCDGVMMSAKKDGLANMGGFIALDDEDLFRRLTELEVLIEGFPTYGGLAGRDLDILAVGLNEAMQLDYLEYRVGQIAYFGQQLKSVGMPIIEPTGGHAVFIDAGKLLSHLGPDDFPAQSLACAFYIEGAVRPVEIGSLMFGGIDPETGKRVHAPRELVRMAVPRRVYSNTHLDYVVSVAEKIVQKKSELPGYRITRESPFLRHFTCEMEPMELVPAEK